MCLNILIMERISFEYSTKNIPTASKTSYLKRFIDKTEIFLKRMRWKAFFFVNGNTEDTGYEYYGFKSNKFWIGEPCPIWLKKMKSLSID